MFLTSVTFAHSPHHDIFDVSAGLRADGSERTFVTVRGNLLYSDDNGGSWQRALEGLAHGYQLFSVAVAPSDPRVVYVGSLGEGGFQSLDGGDTWSPLSHTLPARYIQRWVVSPVDPRIVAALETNGKVFLSLDQGASWRIVGGDDIPVDQLAIDSRGTELVMALATMRLVRLPLSAQRSDPVVILDDINSRVVSLESDYRDGSVWLLGLQNGQLLQISPGADGSINIWQAPNGESIRALVIGPPGESWDLLALAEMDGPWCRFRSTLQWSKCARGLTVHPQALELGRPYFSGLHALKKSGGRTELLIAGYDGLFRSDSPSKGWQAVGTLGFGLIMGLGVSSELENGEQVFVTTYLWGAFQSNDGGKAWRSINRGARDYRRSVGFTRLFNIYPVALGESEQVLFTSTWYRWLRRELGRTRWSQSVIVDREEWLSTHTGVTAGFSPDFPSDGIVLLGSHRADVLRSDDHGETFELVASLPEAINQIAIGKNRAGSQVVFAAGTGALFRSANGGHEWEPILELGRLVHPSLDTAQASILHELGGVAWVEDVRNNDIRASASWVEVSPGFASDQTLFAGGIEGLFRSTDGGVTFIRLDLVGRDKIVAGLAISPGFVNDQTLLVSVRGKGLQISTDAGNTFFETGLRADGEGRFHPGNYHSYPLPLSPPIRFSTDFTSTGNVYGFEGSELWRSDDGGHTWAPMWNASLDWRTRWIMRANRIIAEFLAFKGSRKRQAALALGLVVILVGALGARMVWRRRRSV